MTRLLAGRGLVVAAVAAALSIGVTGIAQAHSMQTSQSLYNGSIANSPHDGCYYINYVYHGEVSIMDTRTDGYAVYANFRVPGRYTGRVDNNGGLWAVRWSSCQDVSIDRIQGCTERPFIPDVCSDWKY